MFREFQRCSDLLENVQKDFQETTKVFHQGSSKYEDVYLRLSILEQRPILTVGNPDGLGQWNDGVLCQLHCLNEISRHMDGGLAGLSLHYRMKEFSDLQNNSTSLFRISLKKSQI